jgi:hypothetical protein
VPNEGATSCPVEKNAPFAVLTVYKSPIAVFPAIKTELALVIVANPVPPCVTGKTPVIPITFALLSLALIVVSVSPIPVP